ncbi:MAG: PQQ-binding-like beta-propeller repeat protein, partial [Thermosynechococcaceae cyanobacterium]
SEGFTPAELLGQDLADLDQTEIHDRFRLASIIYLLLFGDQPFKGRWVGTGDSPQPSELIKAGYWPFGKGSLIQPGPHTIPLSIIHPELQSCFQRCFSKGHRQPQERPSAGEWVKALKLARAELATCHLEVNHIYSRSYGRCYWCDRKAQLNIDIFSPQPQPKRKPTGTPKPTLRPPVPTSPRQQTFRHPGKQPVRRTLLERWAPSTTTLGGLLCLSSLAGLALLIFPDLRAVPQALERSFDQKLTLAFQQLASTFSASNTGSKQTAAALKKPILKGHGDSISTLAISPNGQLLASGSRDFTLKIWNLQTGQLLRTLSEHYEPITSVQFADQGKTLISRGVSGKVLLWDVETGKVLDQLETAPTAEADANLQKRGVSTTPLNAGGTLLASHSWDGNIMLRDLRTNEVRQIDAGSVSAQQAIAITSDAQTLVSSTIDGQIKLWDIPTGKFERSFPKFDDWDAIKAMQLTSSLSVSDDGTRLASGGWGGEIHLWNMQTGQLLKVLTGHYQSISALAFSPDNQLLASGGGDRIINVWRTQNGQLLHTLKGHQGDISALSISPDGQLLISGSNDHTIRIWQLATGQLLRILGKT